MPNGKPGDHPFTDILHYGSSEFDDEVNAVVIRLSKREGFSAFRDEIADILWANSQFSRKDEAERLNRETLDKLADVERRMDER